MEPNTPTPTPQVLFQHLMIAAKLLSPSRDNHALERGPWRDVRAWIVAEHGRESTVWFGYELIDEPRQLIDVERRECLSDLLVSLLERLKPYVVFDCEATQS